MRIEYDNIYKQWVVWKIESRGWFEVFKSKLKKDCREYVRKNTKRGKNYGK